MNILCVSDGSDSGYQTVSLLARIFDPRQVSKIQVLLVAWPQRDSPLWEKAGDLWHAVTDDLHEAARVVVTRELERFRSAFEAHADLTETAVTNGDPVGKVVEYANIINADLILLAITGDSVAVQKVSREIVATSPIPVLVAHGRNEL